MEIIIDINIAPIVFSEDPGNYSKLKQYVISPKNGGTLIYGGTKFIKEYNFILKKNLDLFVELKKSGKVKELNRKTIDLEEKRLKKIEKSSKFDDEHIVACVIHSKCKIVCTDDKRADRFIKDKDKKFYKGRTKPKIYRDPKKHNKLLT